MEKSLKDKTADLRRDHILAAAARSFATSGYQRTTIRDISTAAGVSDGTIYNSFASKQDLLLALLDPLRSGLPTDPGMAEVPPPDAIGPGGIGGLIRARWAALTPEVVDLLRIVLAEALVDRSVGAAFTAAILVPAILPLQEAMASAGVPDAPMAARGAVAAFVGCAVLRMLGDPVFGGDAEAVAARLEAVLAAVSVGRAGV